MSVALVTKFAPLTDELFKAESKLSLLSNTDFDFSGAHAVKIYKISTAAMNNYARNIDDATDVTLSRYGALLDLGATTEELLLSKDRSFIFNIDLLDQDETAQQLAASSALARQIREVVIPEVDTYTYGKMVTGAGTTATATTLTTSNIYSKILAGSEVLDDNECPDTERVLVVTPETYSILKQAVEFDKTDVGAEMRMRGVIGILDGMAVVKVPSSRLPVNFGFMICHPSATVAPVKLEDFGIHTETPISSGTIVTGRICYDAFVLSNKTKAIYVQPLSMTELADANSNGTLTEAELNALTVPQLKVLAQENNITLTATTKAAIITEILTALA